jgi:putative transposase
MPRTARKAPGGYVYHVLNRAVGRMRLFRTDDDFEAFRRVMIEAHERHPLRILAYCVLPNHWHFVVWPKTDGQVTDYFRWLAHTHAMRWRVTHRTVGFGPLYQGRFKSFPVQRDEHLLTVARYVERNAVGAGLVERAELWPYGSLRARLQAEDPTREILAAWPIERPADWVQRVNTPLTAGELKRLRCSVVRNRPFGTDAWTDRTARRLGLEHTLRPEGRPPKKK